MNLTTEVPADVFGWAAVVLVFINLAGGFVARRNLRAQTVFFAAQMAAVTVWSVRFGLESSLLNGMILIVLALVAVLDYVALTMLLKSLRAA